MVSPTPRDKHVPSKDILRCAARRVQPKGVGGDEDGAGNNKRQEEMCHFVSKIWGSVGLVVENSLISAARGVRIESIGTFTLDTKGYARFFLATDFARRFRLLKYDVCSGGCLAGGAVNTRLNVARVAATAGSPRPEAERVLDAVLRALQQRLAAGRSVTLSFHPVAEFSCTPSGQATMRFLRSFRAKEKKAAVNATRARVGVARTNSKPTPWGTASAAAVATGVVSGTAGPAITAKSKSIGRRPLSASSGSMHRFTTDRPETSQLHGDRKRLSTSPNGVSASNHGSSTTRNASLVATNVGRTTATGARTGAALKTSPHIGCNNTRRPTTASSCVSSRCPPDTPSAGRGQRTSCHGIGKASDRSSHNDDEILTVAQEELSFENSELEIVRHSSASGAVCTKLSNRSDLDLERLSGLLRRQTLAQAGDEGLRRLIETLRLTHVSGESGDGSGCGGRLSGRDLLLALRDVGTKLTAADLADTTSVFRRQPDGRISLPVFLAGIAMRRGEIPRQRETPSVKEEDMRLAPTTAREKEVEAASALRIGAGVRRVPSGLPWESSSCQAGSKQAPSPSASWTVNGTGAAKSPLSSPRLSESSTVGKILRKGRLGEEQTPNSDRRRDGNQQQRWIPPGGERKANGGLEEESSPRVLTEKAAVATCSTAPHHARRECWGVDKGNRGGLDATPGSAVAGDAIADLARIVYNPPSSLERLIHVLQASKVCNDQR